MSEPKNDEVTSFGALGIAIQNPIHIPELKGRTLKTLSIFIQSLSLLLIFWGGVSLAQAEVKVVFVEVKGYGGRQVELEQNGRFAHVAISYQGNWLQSYPGTGVELISYADLAKMGKIVMLKSNSYSEPTEEFVSEVLGQPFDMKFSWESDSYYCSKLVAKILELTPSPMEFNARAWPPSYQKLNGQLGISPDDVYEQLMSRGFLHIAGKKSPPKKNACTDIL